MSTLYESSRLVGAWIARRVQHINEEDKIVHGILLTHADDSTRQYILTLTGATPEQAERIFEQLTVEQINRFIAVDLKN